ncbi:MAG: PAS domain S-box protein, partial [Candidatus Omnitrophica bacterium]|nr:PAS domain S-box protein [Candidatus Omnitrophota bacterium]
MIEKTRKTNSSKARLEKEIAARQRVEEILDRQANILRQVKDVIIVIDGDRRITYWNNAAEHLYGYKASETLNKRIESVLRYRWINKKEERDCLRALKAKGSWRGENIHCKRSGEEIYADSAANVLKDAKGGNIGLIIVIRDISERKNMEIELQKAHDELELRVNRRTAELYQANKQLSQQMHERGEISRRIEARNDLLKLLGESSSRKDYLDAVVKLLKDWSKCECVGIRVVNE